VPTASSVRPGTSPENHAALRALVVRVADKLFESISVPVRHSGDFDARNAEWSGVVALLGFAGKQMSGSLLVSAPADLAKSVVGSSVDDLAALRDWSCELSNLLVGSLKTALLPKGITIELGIPTAVVGHELRVQSPSQVQVALSFAGEEHQLSLVLDVVIAQGVEIPEGGADDDAAAFDLMMF
jgi:CheY-specific phosphatase CheX